MFTLCCLANRFSLPRTTLQPEVSSQAADASEEEAGGSSSGEEDAGESYQALRSLFGSVAAASEADIESDPEETSEEAAELAEGEGEGEEESEEESEEEGEGEGGEGEHDGVGAVNDELGTRAETKNGFAGHATIDSEEAAESLSESEEGEQGASAEEGEGSATAEEDEEGRSAGTAMGNASSCSGVFRQIFQPDLRQPVQAARLEESIARWTPAARSQADSRPHLTTTFGTAAVTEGPRSKSAGPILWDSWDPAAALKQRILWQQQGDAETEQGVASLPLLQRQLLGLLDGYRDVLYEGRRLADGESYREAAALHALNHVLKAQDVEKANGARVKVATERGEEVELRDQGFTQAKVR